MEEENSVAVSAEDSVVGNVVSAEDSVVGNVESVEDSVAVVGLEDFHLKNVHPSKKLLIVASVLSVEVVEVETVEAQEEAVVETVVATEEKDVSMIE